jgi:hypothetical protein
MKLHWLVLVIALLPASHAAGTEPIVRIVVKDAYAHGMAVGLGELLDQNVAIASYSVNRLTINNTYNSADEFYSSLAKRLGGTITRKNDVTFIRPSCLASAISEADAPLSSERASFNFNLVRAAALLEVLASQSTLPYQAQVSDEHSPILGLRLKNVSYHAAHGIIATVSGVELRRRGTAYGTANTTSNTQCAETPEVALIPGGAREGDCPSRVATYAAKLGKKMSCEPLEAYPLHELIPRGFVDVAERRFVVLEAADHGTFFARVGNYLGHHLGKISEVDNEGFVVQEPQQDSAGSYYVARIRIDYSNKRTDIPREYP